MKYKTPVMKTINLPFWAKSLLLCSLVLNSTGGLLGGTYGAWQISASIPGNTVTTGSWISTTTIMVNANTSAGENQPGWMFNRDLSTRSPFAFNDSQASIGDGALYISPITNTVVGNSDKFIGELFLVQPIADFTNISYNFNIAALSAADANEFYMNIYTNFGESAPTKYYDCRYDIVPSTGTVGGWSKVSFDPVTGAVTGGTIAEVKKHSSSPFNCPAAPGGMDTLSPGSRIRAIALTVGDSTNSDTGVSGYFDNVVIAKTTDITVYDFEPNTVTSSSETIVVTNSDMNGWVFNSDRTTWTMGTGTMMVGPNTPPAGVSSARITTPTANERTKLVHALPAGIFVKDIVDLEYSTYRAEPSGGVLAAALQFDVDMDGTPVNPAKADGRIVYEPYYTQTTLDDTWQTWNALNDFAGTGTGNWWIAGPNGGVMCTIGNPCTWAELKANYPDMRISAKSLEDVDTQGGMMFKAGGGWAGFDGNVDNFVIGIKNSSNVHTVTYNFETSPDTPYVPQAGDVVINEVMWMGSDPSGGGSTADEWVELHNTTAHDIDLADWVIENLGTNTDPDIVIPSGTIPAGGYFLVGNYPSNNVNSAISNFVNVDFATTDIQLLNSGEQLTVRNASSTLIDQTPGGNWAAGSNTGDLQSMERNSVPGDGTQASSWHTCIDVGCTSTAYWDVSGDNYGTPRALNLSENDPTTQDYVEQDWSHTVAWVPDENDLVDDSELLLEEAGLTEVEEVSSSTEDVKTEETTSAGGGEQVEEVAPVEEILEVDEGKKDDKEEVVGEELNTDIDTAPAAEEEVSEEETPVVVEESPEVKEPEPTSDPEPEPVVEAITE